MAIWMIIWAVASTLTGITHDFKGLLLTRFFLGIAEAPFFPGALYLLSMFYTRKEIATRISILFTANICGTAFAGLIAIGVFKMEGIAGLAGWRWLFILQGIVTFVVAAASAFILPDDPLNTRWLTEEQRQLAHSRVTSDTVGLEMNTSTWAGLLDASKDIRLWVLVFMQHFHMASANFKNFFPTIVGTLGFDRNATLALTCPPYIISGIACIAWGYSSSMSLKDPLHMKMSCLPLCCRPVEREDMAHHNLASHCHCRVYPSVYSHEHRRTIFRNVRLHKRRLCLPKRHSGLGLQHMRPNEGEEIHLSSHGEHHRFNRAHLHTCKSRVRPFGIIRAPR